MNSSVTSKPLSDATEPLRNNTAKTLNELVELSKNLPSNNSELGSIQLGLREISKRTRELRASHLQISGYGKQGEEYVRGEPELVGGIPSGFHQGGQEVQQGTIPIQPDQQLKSVEDHTGAHYLLASSGLPFDDVDSALRYLQQDRKHRKKAPVVTYDESTATVSGDKRSMTPVSVPMDIESYLRVKKEETVLSSIEAVLANAAKDFDAYINSNLGFGWNQKRDIIRRNFGILVNDDDDTGIQTDTANGKFTSPLQAGGPLDSNAPLWIDRNAGPKILDDNTNDSKLNVNENYLVREIFESFAKVVYKFNNARQAKQSYPLINEFINIYANSPNDSRNTQLVDSLRILQSLEKSIRGLNERVNSRIIVSHAKDFLQRQFLGYIEHLCKKKMNEGLPTNINKVKSFIDDKLKNPDNSWKINNLTVVNGVPIWALIFYLLRAGLKNEALEVAVDNKLSFKKIEQSFLGYLKAYVASPDDTLPVEYSTRLHTEYNQHIKNSLNGDPYRLAVYKIIGHCDLTRRNIPSVTLSIEDWLWIHLMLIKEGIREDDPIYERYTLEDFQSVVESYGPAKFGNNYLRVLILSGLYELAVGYLYSFNEMGAVHLAICMANLDLLNIQPAATYSGGIVKNGNDVGNFRNSTLNANKPVSVNAKGQREINFVRLIANYIKSFKFSDPRIATEYILLIGLSTVDRDGQLKLCYEALRELLLETREFTILLGKISHDGIKIPGVFEERLPLLHLKDENDFLRVITEQAARKADEDGRTQDSLILYQLAEEYDTVVSILNGMLSDILSNPDLNQPLFVDRDNSETNPILFAQKLIVMYPDNLQMNKQISAKNRETCIVLLRLIDVRRTFNAGQWQNTLAQIDETNLLPFDDNISVKRKAQDFVTLNPNLAKCIPNLLIVTMTCISNLIQQLNRGGYQSAEKTQQIGALKNVAKNCMVYAGMIQYKMPREVYNTLINLDVGM